MKQFYFISLICFVTISMVIQNVETDLLRTEDFVMKPTQCFLTPDVITVLSSITLTVHMAQ